MKKIILAVMLAAIMLLAAGCAAAGGDHTGQSPEPAVQSQTAAQPAGSGNADLSFETVDIDGGKVTSQELFGAHRVTMLNIWTSWCGYCVMEMPELEAMNRELEKDDCAIVGLLLDAYEENGLEDGRAEVAEAGVTYKIILPWDGCENELQVQAFPTTVFIDRNGNVINVDTVIGADIEGYRAAMEKALELTEE